jgi:hypothetical protein
MKFKIDYRFSIVGGIVLLLGITGFVGEIVMLANVEFPGQLLIVFPFFVFSLIYLVGFSKLSKIIASK